MREDWSKLYKTARWKRLREGQLNLQPLCMFCMDMGKVVSAQVCDHIKPHKGDDKLFSDPDNLQSLCKKCHDSHKQRQESSGILIGGNTQGLPVDPNHLWNKGGEG